MRKKRKEKPPFGLSACLHLFILAAIFLAVLLLPPPSGLTGYLILDKLQVNENIGDEYPVLTKYHWEGLSDGTVYTNEGKAAYSQFLLFRDRNATDPIESCTVRFTQNDDGETGEFLQCETGDDIFEYRLVFKEPLESAVEEQNIGTVISGKELLDLPEKELFLLGQKFVITRARLNGNRISLRLIGSPIQKILSEGENETIVVNDTAYNVNILAITDTAPHAVLVAVNGKPLAPAKEGESIEIGGNPIAAVLSILPNEAGDTDDAQDRVVLSFGSRHLTLEDADYTDDKFNEGRLAVNGKHIPHSKIRMRGTLANNVFSLETITYRLIAAGKKRDVFIPSGGSLASHHRTPFGLLSAAWNMRYEGVTNRLLKTGEGSLARNAIIHFDARNNGYDLRFTNNAGQRYDAPFITISGGTLRYGTEDNDLVFTEGNNASHYTIDKGDYFIATAGENGKGRTHVLQFDGAEGGRAVFMDLAGNTRTMALFPTGAFLSVFKIMRGERIQVPLESITGLQVNDLERLGEEIYVERIYEIPGTRHVIVESEASFIRKKITICRGEGGEEEEHCVSFMSEVGINCASEKMCSIDVPGEGKMLRAMVQRAPVSQIGKEDEEKKEASCTDTDGGINYQEAGEATEVDEEGRKFKDKDSCSGGIFDMNYPGRNKELREVYCKDDKIAATTVECLCLDNACIETRRAPARSCEDEEGEINYYKKGTVVEKDEEGKETMTDDSCISSALLEEVYCKGAGVGGELVPCTCIDGACIEDENARIPSPKKTASQCEDSDGGEEPNIAGIVTEIAENGVKKEYEDACQDPYTLVEGMCQNGAYVTVLFSCDCRDGRCAAPQAVSPGRERATCLDSDGGFEPYVVGYVSGVREDGTSYQMYDACYIDEWKYAGEPLQREEYLLEKVCDGNLPAEMEFSLCTNCLEGACERPPQETMKAAEPPKAEHFDASRTTDFSSKSMEELSRLENMNVGKEGIAQVQFEGAVDVRGLDLDKVIVLEPNKVTIDAKQAPELNTSATIILENIDMEAPVIYKDGKPCVTCRIISYDRQARRLVFTTEGFSTFQAIDAAGLGRGTLVLSGHPYEFFVDANGTRIVVDQNGDGTLNGASADIHVLGYGILELGSPGSTIDIVLRTLRRYIDEATADETTTIRFSVSGNDVKVSLPNLNMSDAGETEEALTRYGTLFVLEDKNVRNDLSVHYPSREQRSAQVTIT